MHKLPGSRFSQLLDGIVVAHLKFILRAEMLIAHSEDDVATWHKCLDHVLKAACREEVGAKTMRADHQLETSLVIHGHSLFANDERLDVFVEVFPDQRPLLRF